MDIISHADAKARGLRHFFTGKPCKHGHVAPRFVTSWNCCVCHAKASSEAYAQRVRKEVGAPYWHRVKVPNAAAAAEIDAFAEKLMVEKAAARKADPYATVRMLLAVPHITPDIAQQMGYELPPEYK